MTSLPQRSAAYLGPVRKSGGAVEKLSLAVEGILGSHGGDEYYAIDTSEAIHVRTLDNLYGLHVVEVYHLKAGLHAVAENKHGRGSIYGVLCAKA